MSLNSHPSHQGYLHNDVLFTATFVGWCKDRRKYKWIKVKKKNKTNEKWADLETGHSANWPKDVKVGKRYKFTASFRYSGAGTFTNIEIISEVNEMLTVDSILNKK